jgi:hypothetical protein
MIMAGLPAAPAVVDPHWASVVSLLNGQGANGSTSIIDATGRHTWAPSAGAPTIQDGMVYLDGASALVSTDNPADWNFPGDFTIEGELDGDTSNDATVVFLSNLGGDGTYELFTRGSSSNWGMGIYGETSLYWERTPPVITNSRMPFAITRLGTTVRVYAGGAKWHEENYGGNYVAAPAKPMYVGCETPATPKFLKGGILLRVTKGVARYTGDTYTPPTWPLPTSA